MLDALDTGSRSQLPTYYVGQRSAVFHCVYNEDYHSGGHFSTQKPLTAEPGKVS